MMPPIEVRMGASMRTEKLTERQRTTLEHLKHAQELGSTLPDYATAFGLNVKALYNGRTQLQRKGLWPKTRSAPRARPALLAVQVVEPVARQVNEDWVCRLSGPGGWMLECRQLPEAAWLSALSSATSKAGS
jgi:hypothetical protein